MNSQVWDVKDIRTRIHWTHVQWFTAIVNELNALGERYTTHQKIKKILRSLPKIWRPKSTIIQEAKDLKNLAMDKLIGSLKVHEQ